MIDDAVSRNRAMRGALVASAEAEVARLEAEVARGAPAGEALDLARRYLAAFRRGRNSP